MQKITIKGGFTTLNEYINAERSNKFKAAKIKKEETERAYWHFKNKPKIRVYPISISFTWFVKNRGRDLDNVSFAKKFILDGMVKAGYIENDNLTKIIGFEDYFVHSEDEKVLIIVE